MARHTARLKEASGVPEAATPADRPADRIEGEADSSGRQKLLAYLQSGHDGTNQDLAARFGVSPASISVYRSQFKKLGVTGEGARGSAAGRARAAPARAAARPEIRDLDRVLVESIETQLKLMGDKHPDIVRPIDSVMNTLRMLLKLRH